jgi:hypothetical protein
MHLELYQYVEGDDRAEVGEYLGYVSLEDEDDIYIDLSDDSLAEELERLFSEPLKYNDPILNEEKEADPYTASFFKRVTLVLPEYGVRGIFREDEDREVFRETIIDDDEEIIEDEEAEMSSRMMSIEDISDDYNIPDEDDGDGDPGREEEDY